MSATDISIDDMITVDSIWPLPGTFEYFFWVICSFSSKIDELT
jgi:hypothetical protein